MSAAEVQNATAPGSSFGRRVAVSTTSVLFLINVAVFLAMAVSSGHLLKFSGDQVLRWGGNYGPLTLDGQPWRIVSTMFVHIGLLHLAVNLWALYELGDLAEKMYGWSLTLKVYLLTGVAGSIASLLAKPTIVSAGASGAIFGLAGALIATLVLHRLAVRSRELTIVLASLVVFAAYNLTYGFLKGGIDNGAHVGGLFAGILLGIALSAAGGERRKTARHGEGLIFWVVLAVLAMAFLVTRQGRRGVAEIETARQALQQGDADLAIRRLSTPRKTAEYFSLLAAAYAEKNQYAAAEADYKRALQLDGNDFSAHSGLGLLLIGRGQLDEGRKELEKAVGLDPEAGGVWLELGIVGQQQGRFQESVVCLKRAVALNPNSFAVQFALGISEMNLRQYGGAIAAFQKATQLDPTNYSAQTWLGNAYEARGMTAQAGVAYARAQQLRNALARRAAHARRN